MPQLKNKIAVVTGAAAASARDQQEIR